MPDNIWLYGFDGFNGLKTVGFVIANTDTEAEHKVWRMYNDFGTFVPRFARNENNLIKDCYESYKNLLKLYI